MLVNIRHHFLHEQTAMVELKMNKALCGIDEKTILQHTFKFTDPDEWFQIFRLVCKSWKDAVETIKFNRAQPDSLFWNIDKIIKNGFFISPFFGKYLQCFKKLHAPMASFFFRKQTSHHFSCFKQHVQIKFHPIVFFSSPNKHESQFLLLEKTCK